MIPLPKVGFYRLLCRIRNFVGQHAARVIGASDHCTCQQPDIWPRQNKRRVSPLGLFLNGVGNTGRPRKKACIIGQERLSWLYHDCRILMVGHWPTFLLRFVVMSKARNARVFGLGNYIHTEWREYEKGIN